MYALTFAVVNGWEYGGATERSRQPLVDNRAEPGMIGIATSGRSSSSIYHPFVLLSAREARQSLFSSPAVLGAKNGRIIGEI